MTIPLASDSLTERASRKPIPKRERQWLEEVKGVSKFLSELDGYMGPMGRDWVESQRVYYTARLRVLLGNQPDTLFTRGVIVQVVIQGSLFPSL